MKTLGKKPYEAATARTRPARMKWWSEARFGMFVHWGLYSLIGRHEWVQAMECIPLKEYRTLADKFRPKRGAARAWARLARDAGMKYMVMTTKHHDGFCLWDTEQTDYNSVKSACGRDLVKEYVDACREYGLKVGFYYSLMDWNHPDGARAAHDPAARKRFIDFTHGCVRELMSNYGKIDILWYDVPRPFNSHEGWESLAMNQMARSLQPGLIINNRSQLDEDFSTPEEKVSAAESGRYWEACMTFNRKSWGYMPAAEVDAYDSRGIVRMLRTASSAAGNLLLNIGPAPDGSVPTEAIKPLKDTGRWLRANSRAVYGKLDRPDFGWFSACGGASVKGRKLYFWVDIWAGKELALGGFSTKLRSARLLVSGRKISFRQEGPRIILEKLPPKSPDKICGITVIELTFDSPPKRRSFATTPSLTV